MVEEKQTTLEEETNFVDRSIEFMFKHAWILILILICLLYKIFS